MADRPTLDESDYKARARTRIRAAVRRIKPYYEVNSAGGSLHVALDDGNMEAEHILWCLKYAEEEGDSEGVELCKLLLDMSVDERFELYDLYDEYAR